MTKPRLLIISFDAVGDRVFDRVAALPHTGAFLRSAAVARDVRSVFVTNTYPVHCSVVTGLVPAGHGLISNELPFPRQNQTWNYRASLIRAKTLWRAAREQGLSTAAVLWPVTGGAAEIRYNVPEIMPRPGDNQVLLNLKNGGKLLQLELFFRYRHLLEGISQPARDRFAAAAMARILTAYRPDLALLHLTCYDTLCHHHGEDFDKLDPALRTLDESLGRMLSVVSDDTAVILFSDHAQIPLKKTVLPNDMLVEMGLLGREGEGERPQNGYRAGESGCFIECCGGSAFFHPGALLRQSRGQAFLAALRERLAESPGFNRFLNAGEMARSGKGDLPFGFCALPGWAYGVYDQGEKAQHGYPEDYPDYGVFYAIRSRRTPAGKTFAGGSLLDIAPLALALLGEGLPPDKQPRIPGLPPPRGEFSPP